MWVTPRISTHFQIYWKISRKDKYWHIQLKKGFFNREKSIEKNYWEKINIDIVNWEKLFDRSAERK